MKWLTILTSAVLALATQATIAQNAEQEVSGEVVEARPDADELSIRVTETDDGRPERVGQTETYAVPPGTPIEMEDDESAISARSVAGAAVEEVQLGDLMPGDEVTVTFEEGAAGRQATRVRQSAARTADQQQQQTPQQDRDYEDTYAADTRTRDRLPGSASPLPLLALAGIGFALVAGALRFRRR